VGASYILGAFLLCLLNKVLKLTVVGFFVGQDAPEQPLYFGVVYCLNMLLILLDGPFFQQDIVLHPIGNSPVPHPHRPPLQAGSTAQLDYGFRQPVQVAHFVPGEGFNLASHLAFAHSVGMAQVLNNCAMLILKVLV